MAPSSERPEQRFVVDALEGRRFGRVRWVDTTGSTNDDLAIEASTGGPEQVLITELQTAGRGRRGRAWTAPTGSSVLMSVLIRAPRPVEPFWSVGAVTLAAALAVTERIDGSCRLKWPNDLLIDGAKTAGVLSATAGDAVIVGIGLNVNWPRELPAELASATAVNHHLPGNDDPPGLVDRAELVVSILGHLERLLDIDEVELRDEYRTQSATIGQRVRLETNEGDVIGLATDVAPDGGLVVVDGSGIERTHWVGDVIHLRPA